MCIRASPLRSLNVAIYRTLTPLLIGYCLWTFCIEKHRILRRRNSWAENYRAGRSLFLAMEPLHELYSLEELQGAVAEGTPLETQPETFDSPLDDEDEDFTSLMCQMEAEADEKDLYSRCHGESAPGKYPYKGRNFDGTG